MATYLNDLRLTELATGEGSGTWGTTTNTSLELIGEALGYATQQVFGSDADATTTIADGASDPARAMYFKITSAGSLTATRTCTIAPNTISRVMFIENATTGSQSIAISQGSGASVTILAGKTAVVYLDGAGSGAAVVDAMAGVDPGVTDTLAEVLAAGNTSGANNLIIDNGQAITTNTINETTAASGVTIDSVLLKDDGVNATNLEITNIKANDGTSAGSIADSTGVVTLASSVLTTADINGGTIDGAVIGGTTPAALSATTGSFSSTLGVTGAATFSSTVAGAFNGTLGATTPASVAATTLSTTGIATFGGNVTGKNATFVTTTAASLITIGDTAAGTYSLLRMYGGSGKYNFQVGVQNNVNNAFEITPSTAVGGTTFTTPALLIDGTSGNVGIGLSSPSSFYSGARQLVVGSGSGEQGITVYGGNTDTSYLLFADGTSGADLYAGQVNYNHADNSLNFNTNGITIPRMTLDASGDLTTTGAATFGGNVVGLTFESSVSSSSTNLATNSGGSLTLKNTSVTDGNFSNIGGYNSNTLVTSQINFVNVSQASRTGAITFNVHNGTSMPEVGRFDASGNLGVGAAATAGVVNANSTRVTIAGTNAASNGGEFIAGGAAAQISMASGTSKSYLWGSGAYPMSFGTNSTERMVLDASGNLGLGVTPSAWGGTQKSLQLPGNSVFAGGNDVGTIVGNNVYWDGSAYKYIATAAANMLQFSAGSYLFRQALSGTAGDPITFTQAMALDASGNLLVGTTTAAAKLDVKTNGTVIQGLSVSGDTTGDTAYTIAQFGKYDNDSTTSQVFINFVINNGAAANGQINANGSGAVAFGSWSDRRLKENITDLPSQLANITALRPVEFDYIESEGGGHQLGFIAQEVEEIYPDLVGERQDGMKTLSGLSKWDARLVKAIQEQQAIIESLTARIKAK
jgi:trimeric autotransporter adhesin